MDAPMTVDTSSPTTETTATEATPNPNSPPMSKNQMKRLKKAEERKAMWKDRRKEEKEKKKTKRRKLIEDIKARGEDINDHLPLLKRRKKDGLTFATQAVVLDFQFYDLMKDKVPDEVNYFHVLLLISL